MTVPPMQVTRMTSMDLRVGGKYRIGKKIGSGSFGTSCFYLCLLLLSYRCHVAQRTPLCIGKVMRNADIQVTFTSVSTLSRAKKSPSSLSLSRPSTRSSSTSPRCTSPWLVVLVCRSFGGTGLNATTMPWSWIFCECCFPYWPGIMTVLSRVARCSRMTLLQISADVQGPVARRPVQLLQPQILTQNRPLARRPARLACRIHSLAQLYPPRHQARQFPHGYRQARQPGQRD